MAWFQYAAGVHCAQIWTIMLPGLHLRSHLPGCLFLKYTLSPILKEGCILSMVFYAILKWFSLQLLMQVCVVLDLAFPSLPRIIAWAPVADVRVNLDPFFGLQKTGFLLCIG